MTVIKQDLAASAPAPGEAEADIPVYNVSTDNEISVPSSQQLGSQMSPAVAVPVNVSTTNSATVTPSVVQATVDVIAPTNMAAGYQFNVDTGSGKMMRVAVPPGGVLAGQRFSAIILSDYNSNSNTMMDTSLTNNNPHMIPTGRWRDDLCDCCKFGCCHAQCCLSCWCTACALGQGTYSHKSQYSRGIS
jgi:hypothetical protein